MKGNLDTLFKPAQLNLDPNMPTAAKKLDPNMPTAAKKWKHCHRAFINFIDDCGGEKASDKYRTLVNYVSHDVYEYIEDFGDHDSLGP